MTVFFYFAVLPTILALLITLVCNVIALRRDIHTLLDFYHRDEK